MKKAITLIILCISLTPAFSQALNAGQVPDAVKVAFKKLQPNATSVKWSKEGSTEFEAEFRVGNIEMSSNFDKAGTWVATETEIKSSELPASVTTSIAKEFAGYKISEAEKVETPTKGMYYEVAIEKGKSKMEVEIGTDGNVIKKQEKKAKGD